MGYNSPPSPNTTSGCNNTIAKPLDSEFCPGVPSAEFETLDSSVPYVVNGALNVSLAIVTTVANILVLLAMRRVTSIRLPSKLLLRSLVLTDLCTGLVHQPQFAAYLFSKTIARNSVQCALIASFYFVGNLFTSASLLTMTAISLDRYAALFFHLKYQQIVTARRVREAVILIWILSLCYASTPLWNYVIHRGFELTVLFINLSAISVAYTKIYRGLRSPQVQPEAAPEQVQQQEGNAPNMERYRKTASAMMWVYAFFLICHFPYFCSASVIAGIRGTALIVCVRNSTYTLVLLSSCLNPFVYCVRLPEVRTEVTKQLKTVFCRNSQQ